LYVVCSGQVRVCRTDDDGHELTVAICSAGDVIGEMALLDGGTRSATVITMTESEIVLLGRSDFLDCLAANSEIAMQVIELLCQRLRATTARAGDLAYLDVEERLEHTLRRLSDRHGVESVDGGTEISLRLTQSDLAAMLGTSRESVSRALSLLKARGLIRSSGRRIVVTSRAERRRKSESRSVDH
ncbi:MAG: Crp/Fnr family transcriptional regulator, partial [Anaerolineae bacterium]